MSDLIKVKQKVYGLGEEPSMVGQDFVAGELPDEKMENSEQAFILSSKQ